MTDPKELQALANSPLLWTEREHAKVIEALQTLARILAASPDVREIEERNRAHQRQLSSAYDSELTSPRDIARLDTQERQDIATLLDVVRRKDAEFDKLYDGYLATRIERDQLLSERGKEAMQRADALISIYAERDRLTAALATSQAETARWSVIANDHQDALVEARRRIEQLAMCPPASAADIAEAQTRVADDYLAIQDGIRRYRRIICAEHRFVGQTEMGARIDVDEWESERGMLVRQNP